MPLQETGMTHTINLSEATLYALGDQTMEENEAIELLKEVMGIINGPDNPSMSIVHNLEDIPSAVQETLDAYNDLISIMDDIKGLTDWS